MLRTLFFCLLGLSAAHAQMFPQRVVLWTVNPGSLDQESTIVGTFTPYNDVMIRAEVPGCIETVHIKEGETVEEGQKLFSLRNKESQARVKSAKAALHLSKHTADRRRQLKEKDFISPQDLEKAEAEREACEAELMLAQEELEKTCICAPFKGVVSMKKVSKGSYVSPGTELIRIQDINPIRFVFQLPQKEIPFLKIGTPLHATTDIYPNKNFKGTIEAIDQSVNETTRSTTVYATFPNEDKLLLPGLYGQALFALSSPKNAGILIPEQALVVKSDGSYVYKKEGEKAVLRKITIGERRADKAEILRGLNKGDQIVLEGQDKLHDGDVIIGVPYASH